MTRRVDFDDIRPAPIEAKFNGQWYKLPADLPISVLASLEDAEGDETPGAEFEIVREQLLSLFRVHQPDLVALPCGMAEMFTVIPRLYWAKQEQEKPTRPTAARTGSKKRKRSAPRAKAASAS